MRILIALESFEYVERLRVACRRGNASRAVGTMSAAAEEEYRCFGIGGLDSKLGKKFRVAAAVRVRVPFQERAFGNVADVILFRTGANVD